MPSSAEIYERETIRRQVVEVLFRLDESYREVLIFRFYENLAPREIAKRLQIPVETVRTRLKRGLEKMRVELDHVHQGDRRAWSLLLLPLGYQKTAVFGLGVVATFVMSILFLGIGLFWFGEKEEAKFEPITVSAEINEETLPVEKQPPLIKEPGKNKTVDSRVITPAIPKEIETLELPSYRWKIVGSLVTEDEKEFLGPAQLRFLLSQRGHLLWEKELSVEGASQVEVEIPRDIEIFSFTGLELVARGNAPFFFEGWGRKAIDVGHPIGGSIPIRVQFLGHPPSSRLRGRVLSSEGPPISGAEVFLGREMVSATTGADGKYEIEFDYSGTYRIGAIHFGYGVHWTDGFDLKLGEDFLAPDIVIPSSYQISGLVIYPDGSPVRNLSIAAVREKESDYTGNFPSPFEDFSRDREVRSQASYLAIPPEIQLPEIPNSSRHIKKETNPVIGLSEGLTNTDLIGKFCFSGLSSSRYWLKAFPEPIAKNNYFWALVAQNPLPETVIDLESKQDIGTLIFHGRRIFVSIVDEKGKEVPGAQLSWKTERYLGSTSASRGEFWGEAGQSLEMKVIAPGAQLEERQIYFPEDRYETELQIVLRAEQIKSEELLLSVEDAQGKSIDSFYAKVTSLDTNLPERGLHRSSSSWNWDYDISQGVGNVLYVPFLPGHYRIKVQVLDFGFSFLETTKEFEVKAGEKNELTIQMVKRPRVFFSFSPSFPDSESHSAVIHMKREGDDNATPLTFLMSVSSTPIEMQAGPVNLIQPGTYVFQVEARGFLPVEVRATLVAGETTELQISLQRN